MAVKFNNNNLTEALTGNQPVVVDFWAEWCGPCRMIGPTIEELSNDYNGKAVVGKLNVDEHQEVAAQYGIRSIPTILFFKDGKLVDKVTGAVPKEVFSQKIDALV